MEEVSEVVPIEETLPQESLKDEFTQAESDSHMVSIKDFLAADENHNQESSKDETTQAETTPDTISDEIVVDKQTGRRGRQSRKGHESSQSTSLDIVDDELYFIPSIAERRAHRNPALSMLERRDVQKMLENIRNNDPSTVVFKVKEHVFADINSVVFDAIVDALAVNKVCQAIYIQNLSSAIFDDQVRHLIQVLKKKKIWCVNIGENYEVSTRMWEEFCRRLPETFVTHLYVSEHVIPLTLKNLMREHIRANRKKHQLHCAYKNLDVIERCTNMWWNPINGVKELKPYVPPPPPEPEPVAESEKKLKMNSAIADPANVAYWQEGKGKGGDKPWKFKCVCGEQCSSYENSRYHPVGRMFECSVCHLWSHVDCVFGDNMVTDDDLEEMEEVLCRPCQHRYRRSLKRLSEEGAIAEAPPSALQLLNPEEAAVMKKKSSKKDQQLPLPKKQKLEAPSGLDDSKPWKFKCKCGEVCSSYEKKLYQPKGAIFSCSQCETRSHVLCTLGPTVTQEEALQMKVSITYILTFMCVIFKTVGYLTLYPVGFAVWHVYVQKSSSSIGTVRGSTNR
jgi:hypothetical protein